MGLQGIADSLTLVIAIGYAPPGRGAGRSA